MFGYEVPDGSLSALGDRPNSKADVLGVQLMALRSQ